MFKKSGLSIAMAEGTLKALAAPTELGAIVAADGGDGKEALARFAKAGIDIRAPAAQLQGDEVKSFGKSWNDLISVIAAKSNLIKPAK